MSHEILGKRFISRVKHGWHNIADRIFSETEEITASEAMREVAGDIIVKQAPVFYELPIIGDDGEQITEMIRAHNHSAIVRLKLKDDDENRVLGITSDSWTAASYVELAGALDELSKKYKIETAGILKQGGLAFLCFRAEGFDVKGDEMRSYMASNFSLTPGIGHKFFHSPVRIECWNTNTMAEQQASINLAIPHSLDSLQRIRLAADLVSQFHEVKERTKEIFESFADFHITDEQAQTVFEAAYPTPNLPASIRLLKNRLSPEEAEIFKNEKMDANMLQKLHKDEETYEKDCQKSVALRETATERMEEFKPVNLRGTGWSAYNAVTEVSDWREGRNADLSLLIGSRSKEKSRAYLKTLELVSNN